MQVAESIRSVSQLKTWQKATILKKCDSILSILSGESGKIQSDLEIRSEP